ncbi:TipAS antibiotic-recognition domain-containing protein, partial [Streptomyces sp. NPDC002920]
MAAAVEHAMEARKMGINLTPEERFEVFGDKDPEQYAEEAEARWGGTEAYAESQRRAARYTKDDWKRMQAEVDAWSERYTTLMAAGEPPAGAAAMDLAEEHRRHIAAWFYDCPYDVHRGLGEMYVSDERFKAFYDSMRPGLAEHLKEAITANAARHDS